MTRRRTAGARKKAPRSKTASPVRAPVKSKLASGGGRSASPQGKRSSDRRNGAPGKSRFAEQRSGASSKPRSAERQNGAGRKVRSSDARNGAHARKATAGARSAAPSRRDSSPTTFPSDCTIAQADDIKAQLARILAQPSCVTLDLSSIRRIDTAALQVLTAFIRERRSAGRDVECRAASEPFMLTAELLGLASFFGPAAKAAA